MVQSEIYERKGDNMSESSSCRVRLDPVRMDQGGLLYERERDVVFLPERVTGHVDDLPWEVDFTLEATGDGVAIREITIKARPDGPAIDANMVRSVPLGLVKDEAVRQAAQHLRKTEEEGKLELGVHPPPIHLEGAFTKRGRRPVTTDLLREAAGHYEEARRLGRRDHLIWIAEQMHVSRATAARYLRRAIDEGLVTTEEEQ